MRIRRGDVVGVVAPSGAIEEARLGAGIAVLEELGLRVVTSTDSVPPSNRPVARPGRIPTGTSACQR